MWVNMLIQLSVDFIWASMFEILTALAVAKAVPIRPKISPSCLFDFLAEVCGKASINEAIVLFIWFNIWDELLVTYWFWAVRSCAYAVACFGSGYRLSLW